MQVSTVREWIAQATPSRGLRDEVADLVVIAWAALRHRGWYSYGSPEAITPKPGGLRPELELRPEPLPTVDEWAAATGRAVVLFTGGHNPHLTPASLAALATRVREQAQGYTDSAARLVTELESVYAQFSLPTDAAADRLATARATAEFVAQLARTTDRVGTVRTVAATPLPGSDDAAARSLLAAGSVATALRQFKWDRLAPLRAAAGTDHAGAGPAERVLDDLRGALVGNEFDHMLLPVLPEVESRAFDWIARFGGVHAPPVTPSPPPPLPRPGTHGSRRRSARGDDATLLGELGAFLKDNPDAEVQVEWRVAG